jgi:hypothetical protein
MSKVNAVRLRPLNKKLGHKMASYVSYVLGIRYKAGTTTLPSSWRIVNNQSELAELRSIPQFEHRTFGDVDELEKLIQDEMETGARLGMPAVRAKIEDEEPEKPVRDLSVLSGSDPDVIERQEPDEERAMEATVEEPAEEAAKTAEPVEHSGKPEETGKKSKKWRKVKRGVK